MKSRFGSGPDEDMKSRALHKAGKTHTANMGKKKSRKKSRSKGRRK